MVQDILNSGGPGFAYRFDAAENDPRAIGSGLLAAMVLKKPGQAVQAEIHYFLLQLQKSSKGFCFLKKPGSTQGE
jgi:hypothetical protein